jgi:hypothetical protein
VAWNSLTNQRAVQTTMQLVVALCHQMEGWRRILRHIERIEKERDAEMPSLLLMSGGPPARPGDRASNRL